MVGAVTLVRKQSFQIADRKDLLFLLCAGAVLALHWWSFLESIQLSTVAIGTITFSSFPLFVTFLEPLMYHQKLRRRNVIIAVVLLPFVINAKLQPSLHDLALLLFLGVVTTALAHTLFISSLKTIPAQLAGVCSSMETVYGILFAFLLLGEIPTIREIMGAIVIVGAVMIAQIRTAGES